MNVWKKTGTVAFAAATLLVTGCATSFQGSQLEPVAELPAVQPQRSVYIDLAFTGEYNGKPWTEADEHNTRYLKERCVAHLEKSGLFNRVSTTDKNTDLVLYVAVINSRVEPPTPKLLSNLTLTIIPAKSTDTFRMQAILRDPVSAQQHSIKLTQSVIYWQELLLTPLSLFKSARSGLDECKSRLFDNLCLEIQQSGMLD